MTIAYIEVRKFAYLNTPTFSATAFNTSGGSFSNSGQKQSLKALASHLWNTYRDAIDANRAMPVVVETWHGFDENDQPVTTMERTDIDALLSRTGVTRGL